VVDMKNYREATKCSSVVFDQIKAADIILLSKTDLLDAELLISRKKELRLLNPAAMMINCLNGEVNPALLYAETNDLAVQSFKCNNKFKHAKHAHSHTEDGLAAIKITFDKALDKHKFIEKLNGVPQSIYRIKGVVKFVGINDSCFVQMVNGQSSLSPASGKEFSESFIICIGDSDSLNILNQYYFIN